MHSHDAFYECITPNVNRHPQLRDFIVARNEENQRSRPVAGYCWNWASKKDPAAHDIVFPEHDFAMRWNLKEDGSLWIMKPESINDIGCPSLLAAADPGDVLPGLQRHPHVHPHDASPVVTEPPAPVP